LALSLFDTADNGVFCPVLTRTIPKHRSPKRLLVQARIMFGPTTMAGYFEPVIGVPANDVHEPIHVLFSLGVAWPGNVSGFYIQVGKILMRLVDCLMAFPAYAGTGSVSILGRADNVIVAWNRVWDENSPNHAWVASNCVRNLCGGGRGWYESIIFLFVAFSDAFPIIVQGIYVRFSVLTVASLDFLGVGAPPSASWGADISLSRVYITRPWTMIFPGFYVWRSCR